MSAAKDSLCLSAAPPVFEAPPFYFSFPSGSDFSQGFFSPNPSVFQWQHCQRGSLLSTWTLLLERISSSPPMQVLDRAVLLSLTLLGDPRHSPGGTGQFATSLPSGSTYQVTEPFFPLFLRTAFPFSVRVFLLVVKTPYFFRKESASRRKDSLFLSSPFFPPGASFPLPPAFSTPFYVRECFRSDVRLLHPPPFFFL